MVFAIPLETHKCTRKDTCFSPNVTIRNDCPVGRAPLNDFGNLFHDLLGARVSGIEPAASRSKLCLCHRRMPCFGRPQHPFPILWKAALEDVNVDGGVIKELRRAIFCAAKEVELRFRTRFEGISMFARFET